MHGPTFMAQPARRGGGQRQHRPAARPGLAGCGSRPSRRASARARHRRGDLPGVADVRVLGAIGVVEMREPLTDAAQTHLVDQGVWLRPFGRLLYTMPPYVTDGDDLARITSAMVATAATV